MKKIFLLFLVSPVILYAQLYDYKIKVEIDNSAKYRYEEAYYKASADYQNKEIADGLKNKADEYFVNLQRFADFMNDKKLNSKEVEDEFKRLKYFGEDILNLITLLNSNDLTANKMEYTIKKAVDEFNYSTGNDSGNLRKLLKKNSRIKYLSVLTNEELLNLILSKSKETKESINNFCSNDPRNCMIAILLDLIDADS